MSATEIQAEYAVIIPLHLSGTVLSCYTSH